MNKLIAALLLSLTLSITASAQAGDAFETHMRVYRAALKNYDIPTAINALYVMEAIKPERTDLNDSLAILYFQDDHYGQAMLVAEGIVNADPKRLDMLEIVAVSKQKLGFAKEALTDFEKLYGATKRIGYLYEEAYLQLQLERFGECLASLDQITASPDAEKERANLPLQNGKVEVVPMKAAAYFLRGICADRLNQPDAAKENLNKAVQIYPDFVLAKANLEALANKKADAKSTGGSTTTTKPSTNTTTPKK